MKRACLCGLFCILLVNLFSQIPDNIFRGDDRLLEQFVDNWIEESWANNKHHVYEYNDEGILTEYTIYTWANDEWQNYKLRTYSYNEEGLLIEMIVQNTSSGNWINYQRYTYLYNEDNLQSDYYYYIWENENWQETHHHEFVYDDNQILIEHYKYVWSGSHWSLDYGNWYTYNTNGQLIVDLNRDWWGYWQVESRDEFSYNAYGDVATYQHYRWEDNSWMLYHNCTYEYEYIDDIKQSMIATYCTINDYKEIYSYDNNNLVETILQDWSSSTWVNDTRTISIYGNTDINDFEIVNIIGHLNIYPNPFNPSTTISFSVTTPGVFVLDIYNIKGERVTTLLNENLSVADYKIKWHGKDDNNNNVASGIYFGRLLGNNRSINISKMILLK